LSRARRAELNGRLYAEVRLLKFFVLSPLSLGYHPGIDCRERVKELGAVTESFLVEQLKPGLSFALELSFGLEVVLLFLCREEGLASLEGLVC